jgi:quinol monooxygenase YgiN
MIVIRAEFPIDPEHREEALEAIRTLVEASNEEPGMIDYRAATDVIDGNTVRFFEQYEDAEAFEAHSNTQHYETFEKQLPEFLAGEPHVVQYDVDDATMLDL